jgi:SAM-dependent methyltransferase
MTTTFDWTSVAPAWDAHREHVERSSAPVAEALVAALGVTPGQRVLELAAGTGELAARLAGLIGPEGSVLATDGAAGMVALCEATLQGLPQASAARADAADTGLPAAAFDAVACCMGLMFVPEPVRALQECRRVLVPGGRVAAAVWAGPQHNPWLACLGMAAMVHGLVAGGPPTGPGGLFSLADPDVLRQAALTAGLQDVRVDEVAVRFRFVSADEHVAVVSSLAGPLSEALAAASGDQRAAVRTTAAELAAPHRAADGSMDLPGLALVLSARA